MRKLFLSVDWRDEDDRIPEDRVSALLVGTVRTARYNVGRDSITLEYQDGRTVTITLNQCRSCSCDRTCMVLEDDAAGSEI